MKVPFIDLQKQCRPLKKEINKAIADVLKKQNFILGEEVHEFEKNFAEYNKVKYAVGLNSGTDALFLSLIALGIGPGDEVIVPAFTFIATAFVVSYTGAVPVFVDVDERTFAIDCAQIAKAVTKKTKAIIPVHLFGQCADMDKIRDIAKKHSLYVIEDACQSHGAEFLSGRDHNAFKSGSMGDTGAFSFYPTKNLGGFGDGGMITTNSGEIHEKLLKLRDCGRKSKYEHSMVGYNSRLDTLQAAVLNIKLKYLDAWNEKRRKNAGIYSELLKDIPGVIIPECASFSTHVFHVFAVRLPNRDKVVEYLRSKGIGVLVNYPLPLHLQDAYRHLGYREGMIPTAEKISKDIISLPMHPSLEKGQIEYVVTQLKNALKL